MDEQKKKNAYFSKRIGELQRLRGYSTNYVIENLFFDNGEPVINDRQVLDKYKSGIRNPQHFEATVRAFAKFYNVTTDYLLGADDVPNRQIKSVQEVTGLGEQAIRRLTQLKDQYPDILAMVDAIIAGTEEYKDIADYITLYNQIFEDYKDLTPSDTEETADDNLIEVLGLAAEMRKVQKRFFLTQALYAHWQRIVTAKLAPTFEKEKKMEEDQRKFGHTQKDFDAMCDIDASRQTIINIALTPTEDGINDN
ncbi:MAG: hypothetical protein HDT15_12190 [Oscillibacter sp.]|nr:hypothetical protein [Oscillibacter sp.]